MDKYLTIFESHSQYIDPEVKPNVSYCIQEDEVHYSPFDPFNGHAYVDLGLPSGTLWATMNVGQGYPSDNNSLLFGWGTTNTQDSYINVNTKYNSTDKKTRLDLEDDAARANWGGLWRIPTTSQYVELIRYTTASYQINKGWILTSNINGNTLIIKELDRNTYPSSNPYNTPQGVSYDYISGLHPTNISLYPGVYERDDLCAIRPVINKDPLINDLNGVIPVLNGEGPVYQISQKDFVITLTSPIKGTINNAVITINNNININVTTITDNLVFSGSSNENLNLNGPGIMLTVYIEESSDPIILEASFKGYNPK